MLIAAHPSFDPFYGIWLIDVLVATGGVTPSWRRHHPSDTPEIVARGFLAKPDAVEQAKLLNAHFLSAIEVLGEGARRSSLLLRHQKALQSRTRLADEEAQMALEAQERGRALATFDPAQLLLHEKSEPFRVQIAETLAQYPYVRSILVGEARKWKIVQLSKDGRWSQPYWPTRQGVKSVHRAAIANGFGLSEFTYWGKTKAEIRRLMLPNASKLITQPNIAKLLADALARGKRALVWGNWVFWYEGGAVNAWQVKERSGSADKDVEAIWFEGDIYSANFGRIVVLPYIKDNGERVRGHTKNAPHDGKAKLRPAGQELLIPFEVLDGDLMIDLLGRQRQGTP